jgi:uncharacterized protein (TIGR03437 family)
VTLKPESDKGFILPNRPVLANFGRSVTFNSAGNPAAAGATIVLYASGLGQTNPTEALNAKPDPPKDSGHPDREPGLFPNAGHPARRRAGAR